MLGCYVGSPEFILAHVRGRVPRMVNNPISRAVTVYEEERRSRLEQKPFNPGNILQAAAECLCGSMPGFGGIYSVQWIKTPEGFIWPFLYCVNQLPGEIFALKLVTLASIWVLNPSVFCDADFSSWLGDDYFLEESRQKAERQVSNLLSAVVDTGVTHKPTEIDKDVQVLLDALRSGALSRTQLEKVTGFSRTYLNDHAIHPALTAGWIETTEKKPSSPRQKYRITEKGWDLLADRSVSRIFILSAGGRPLPAGRRPEFKTR